MTGGEKRSWRLPRRRVPESTIQYYPVYGNTPYALHTSMIQNGPFNEIVQRRVYAEIYWQLKWKFDYTYGE